MGTATESAAPPAHGWNLFNGIVVRFAFVYWLLYSLPVILSFPAQLASMVIQRTASQTKPMPPLLVRAASLLEYPSTRYSQGTAWLTPKVCQAVLDVTVEAPTGFTGSGDRLYNYCSAFTDFTIAVLVTVVWTITSGMWRLRTRRRPNYDCLHAWLRAIVRFHLMYQMLVYGAMKVWCAQFPPIGDGQLETKYGDSSPMGLLWRFMEFSQAYTSTTGIVEFTCGLLLIFRRTALLGAVCSLAASFQVFLLNMCYDVPVKLMSGHLLLMALTLTVVDARRLAALFILNRPVEPRLPTPLFGNWRRLNRAAVILRTSVFGGFAALQLYSAYSEARTEGMLAPENPTAGRWIGKDFVRDGQAVPFPEQPENPPPRQVTPSAWKGGPGMPPVIRFVVGPGYVTVMFDDGSGLSYRNISRDHSEFALMRLDEGPAAKLRATFPETNVMILEGPFEGQNIRMTLRRAPAAPKRDYLLRSREFHWVQDVPFKPVRAGHRLPSSHGVAG